MAKGKEMTAVVSIAGTINPSLGKSISSAQKSISGLGASIKSIGLVGVGVAAAAGVGTIGAAAVATTAKLYNMGEEWKKAQNLIRVGTGKTGADLGKLEKSFENIYGQFEGSKELIAQTIADANTLTDAEGKALEDYAMNILDAAADLKIDTGVLLKNTAAFFKAFNIDNNDMAAMTDYIFKVSQATGVGMDKLAEYSQRNAAAFKELGLGSKHAIAIIGQMTKAGVDIDGAIAGIRKSVVELNKVDKKTGKRLFANSQEAIRGMIGKIRNAKTEQEGIAVSMSVFGLKAGNEMAKAIREGKLDIEEFVKAMDASDETIAKMGADTELVSDKFIQMWHQIELAMKPLSEKFYQQGEKIAVKLQEIFNRLMPMFKEWMAKLMPYFDKLGDKITAFLDGLDMDEISRQVAEFGKTLMGAFKWFLKNSDRIWFWFKIIATVIGVVLGVIILVKLWIVAAVIAIVAALITVVEYWDDIIQVIKDVNDWLSEKIGAWKYLILSVMGPVGILIGALWAIWENWDSISGYFFAAFAELKEWWQAVSKSLKLIWEGLCEGDLKKIWEGLMVYFSYAIGKFKIIAEKITVLLKDAFTKVRDWVSEIVDAIARKFTKLFDGIKNAGNQLKDWGKNALNKATFGMFAQGGFTSGPSICGEAGTEAVISFDPRYREENQGYLLKAADMLGMVAPAASAGGGRQSIVNLGGVNFSPTIHAGGGARSEQSILEQLEDFLPDFIDRIEEAMAERKGRRYA